MVSDTPIEHHLSVWHVIAAIGFGFEQTGSSFTKYSTCSFRSEPAFKRTMSSLSYREATHSAPSEVPALLINTCITTVT